MFTQWRHVFILVLLLIQDISGYSFKIGDQAPRASYVGRLMPVDVEMSTPFAGRTSGGQSRQVAGADRSRARSRRRPTWWTHTRHAARLQAGSISGSIQVRKYVHLACCMLDQDVPTSCLRIVPADERTPSPATISRTVSFLVWGADLHIAQLMQLLLTVSCFSKIQIGLHFWYRLTRVVP